MLIKSKKSKFALSSALAIVSATTLFLMTTTIITPSIAYAQPETVPPCPEGYELNRGICQAEPRYGCLDENTPVVPGEDLCITGSALGSMIPFSPPTPPCGAISAGGDAVYVYPHPYDPNPRVCAIAQPMYNYCPQDDGMSGADSRFINPETGKCEVKPGRPSVNPACPEGTTSFSQGYCRVKQVPTCPEGFEFDREQGNCDNPETGVMNQDSVFRCANDLSDPDLSNGCRFIPGESGQDGDGRGA
jgi:hypothetical protein